jgi:hypothetical protein
MSDVEIGKFYWVRCSFSPRPDRVEVSRLCPGGFQGRVYGPDGNPGYFWTYTEKDEVLRECEPENTPAVRQSPSATIAAFLLGVLAGVPLGCAILGVLFSSQ